MVFSFSQQWMPELQAPFEAHNRGGTIETRETVKAHTASWISFSAEHIPQNEYYFGNTRRLSGHALKPIRGKPPSCLCSLNINVTCANEEMGKRRRTESSRNLHSLSVLHTGKHESSTPKRITSHAASLARVVNTWGQSIVLWGVIRIH